MKGPYLRFDGPHEITRTKNEPSQIPVARIDTVALSKEEQCRQELLELRGYLEEAITLGRNVWKYVLAKINDIKARHALFCHEVNIDQSIECQYTADDKSWYVTLQHPQHGHLFGIEMGLKTDDQGSNEQ